MNKHTHREIEDQGVKNKILNTLERNIKIYNYDLGSKKSF